MAEDIKKVISIEVNGENSVKDLKNNIASLRDALVNCESGSEEYKKVVDELIEKETKLSQVMNAGKKEVHAAAGSYNALSQEMSALKKVWKEVTDESQRAEIGERIAEINTKLKDMDASLGNFQRNVGNYQSALAGLNNTTVDAVSKYQSLSQQLANLKTAWESTSDATEKANLAEQISKVQKEMESFDSSSAVGSYKSLTDELSNLKKAWQETADETERAQLGEKIANVQSQIKEMDNALAEYSKALEESSASNSAAAGSYDDLASQLATLKSAWSATADETERAQLGEKIAKLQSQMQKMDASVMQKGFAGLKDSLISTVPAIGKVNTALKGLATNPIGAVITAIVLVVQQLSAAFKRNEDAMATLKKATAPLQAALQGVQRIFDGIVNVVAKAVGKLSEFVSWIGKVTGLNKTAAGELVEANQKIADMELEVTKMTRENTEANAEAQKRIAEYQQIFEDNTKSVQERQEAIKKAEEEELGIAERNVELKKKELELLKLKNSLTKSSSEDLQAEADAAAALAEAETEYIKKQTELIKKRNEVNSSAKSSSSTTSRKSSEKSEAEKQAEEERKKLADLEEALEENKKTELQKLTEKYEAELALMRKYNRDTTELTRQFNEEKARIEEETKQKEIKNTEQGLENLRDVYQEGTADWLKADIELKQAQVDNLIQLIDETDEEFKARLIQAKKALEEAKKKYDEYNNTKNNQQKDEKQLELDNDATQAAMEYGYNSMQAYDARIASYKNYRESLTQLQEESNEEFRARQLAADKQLADEEKAQQEQRLMNYDSLASGIGDIMGSIADYWQSSIEARIESGEISEEEGEKEFENVKKLQIAQATISTIQGAIQAYMGCQSLGQPWGTVIGLVQAAAVTAAGVAQIAKIKQTTLSSGGSTASVASTAVATPQVTDYTPEYVQNVQSSDETENLANAVTSSLSSTPIKAYVVESEITTTQNKSKQRQEEATF